jgi:hypothetical protein
MYFGVGDEFGAVDEKDVYKRMVVPFNYKPKKNQRTHCINQTTKT